MKRLDHIGSGHVKHLDAPIEIQTAEVAGTQSCGVERRACSSIEDHDTSRERIQVRAHAMGVPRRMQ